MCLCVCVCVKNENYAIKISPGGCFLEGEAFTFKKPLCFCFLFFPAPNCGIESRCVVFHLYL